jgi:uncharacterized cupin superfamily protein
MMTSTRFRQIATLVVGIIFLFMVAAIALSRDHAARPAKIGKAEMAGAIFDSPDMLRTEHDNGNVTLDVTSLKSSDGRFASGMYRSDKVRFEIDEPYGVDEFMYFLEGSVTLTSADGSVQTINAGEAVTIPKEWTGVWDTDGYTKIWVIYSADGSGL